MRDKPTWEPIRLRCTECGHPWDDWQPNNVPSATWIAHVKAYRCPKCGAEAELIALRGPDESELGAA